MTATDVQTAHREIIDDESDVIHLTCCRDGQPAVALCGWVCLEHAAADDPGPECVVCGDIADGYPSNTCVRGGRCPA